LSFLDTRLHLLVPRCTTNSRQHVNVTCVCRHRLVAIAKEGTYYPFPQAVFTGPWTWVSFLTPVFTRRVHGPWTPASFGHPCSRPWTQPVNTTRG